MLQNTQGAPSARPTGARPALVVVCFVAYLNSLHLHQEIVYAGHFLIFARPKPGGVYIYIWCPRYVGSVWEVCGKCVGV